MTRRRPSRRPLRSPHHRVADFSSLHDLIEHAKTIDGASHLLIAGRQAKIYFPRRDGRYDEGTVWQEHGYWHAPAPSDRVVVTGLPVGAEPIGSHTQRVGRRASEARGREIQHELWLCEDCTIAEVNGDTSGMTDERAAEVERGIDQLTKRVGPISANWDSETEDGIIDFTSRRCDACGSGLAGSRHRFASFGRERVAEAKRRREPASPAVTNALHLAGELSKKVDGSTPKEIQGGFRWSEKNEAAQFTTYSPEHQQKVVVVVALFEDGSTAVDYFSDEYLSETDRYENVGHFTYPTASELPEMVKDIRWVWETVDGYAASWQEGEGDVEEQAVNRSRITRVVITEVPSRG
jgi:hypothetical protein